MVHEMNHLPLTVTPHGHDGPNATYNSVDNAYVIISNVVTVVSILGNVVVVGCYYVYSDIRTTGRKLVASLAFANFFMCVGNLLQVATFYKSTANRPSDRSVLCEAAALVTVYGSTATFLWTDAISFYLFLCVTLRFIVVANKVTWLFHIFSWAMPAVIAFSAGASDVYGYDDTFLLTRHRPAACWISDRVTNKNDWQIVTVEGWALTSYCICALLFLTITCSIRCQKARKNDEHYVIEDLAIVTAHKQLRYIPLTFIILRMWSSLYFVYVQYGQTYQQAQTGDWLLLLKALGDSSIGWVNCILFLVSVKPLRKRIAKWFRDRWRGKVKIPDKWRPSIIVRKMKTKKSRGLDISGISLSLHDNEDSSSIVEDDIIFELTERN